MSVGTKTGGGILPRTRRPERFTADLLTTPRYEVFPTRTIESQVLDAVPRDVTITVTASPSRGLEATIDLAERLVGHGYHVVPHLSARLVRDAGHLDEVVNRIRCAGIDEVFVPAGDADPPAGEYHAALPVLAELTRLGRPVARVGITGYPESHPAIDDDVTVQAMWDKRVHATYIVSNLCFDAETLASWVRRVRRRGVQLPIHLGVAGPVERTKLLSVATKIGVGESVRFLAHHRRRFLRMTLPAGYSPDRLLQGVGRRLVHAETGVVGLHVYTFNQVAETERWRQHLLVRADHAASRTP